MLTFSKTKFLNFFRLKGFYFGLADELSSVYYEGKIMEDKLAEWYK